MKKTIVTLFIILAIAFAFTGCGGKANENGQNNNENAANDTEKADEQGNTENENNAVTDTGIETFEERVLLDQGNIKITATSLGEDVLLGPAIKLLIENNSETNITVQAREVSVNGYMIEPLFSTDVAAGKKANDSMTFLTETLEASGIVKIAFVEFRFDIFNTDTFDEIIVSDVITLNTSVTDYVQSYDDTGNVIYDANNIKIIDKGIQDDTLMGPEILIYIENNSDVGVTVQTRDVSINGFMVEPVFSSEITPGKKAVDGISFLNLEENNIEEITDVELSFEVFNTETWDTIVETDQIKLTYGE